MTTFTGVARWALVVEALLVASGSAQAQGSDSLPPSRCPRGLPPFSTPFCSELVAVPDLPATIGMMELQPVRSPFGVAVTPDGRLRHRLVVDIDSLPPPSRLGSYTRFTAWVYTLTMDRELKLGDVHNGRISLGEVPYEPFRLLVVADGPGSPSTRRGKLVMRTTSPSALLLAHRDAVMAMTGGLSGGITPTGALAPSEEHMDHAMPGMWPVPPDDPRIRPMAMAHITPVTPPFLPDTSGRQIEPARPRDVLAPRNGDTLTLRAGLVRRTIGSRTFVMYGYNGQYPGPLLRVSQGTELVVRFVNQLDLPSTVHWHGLRVDNRFDGVAGVTQDEVAPGDSFTYHLRFPDAGIYWYHPHVREDIQQELGLYGNILVAARRAADQVPVHREEILTLDDFLMDSSGAVPFGRDVPTYALMGRFGNTYLVNGEPSFRLRARPGEVVRFYVTNVANARSFNLRIPGARMKLVASDLGEFEREEWVESVIIAPAERYVVEARFPNAGRFALVNGVQWLDHMLGTFAAVDDTVGTIDVTGAAATPDYATSFRQLRRHPAMVRELAPMRERLNQPVDHELTLGVSADSVAPLFMAMLTGVPVPVDWNDGMPMMNWPLTSKEVHWYLRDEQGRENMDIKWQFKVGDVVRIRLTNDPATLHAMAHPIHFHGQRFVVITRNGVVNDNLVWKDTALLPAGETMDILLELSNPGVWMAHCHIAEHLGAGMMMAFEVLPKTQ